MELTFACDFFIVLDFKVNRDWVVARLPFFRLLLGFLRWWWCWRCEVDLISKGCKRYLKFFLARVFMKFFCACFFSAKVDVVSEAEAVLLFLFWLASNNRHEKNRAAFLGEAFCRKWYDKYEMDKGVFWVSFRL